MSASVFGSGFGGGGGGGGGITTPVSIANGGTGQITANAAFNALAALTLGQSAAFALSDNITNSSPVARVLSHLSSGTTANGFGASDAVDLQSAGGTLRRVATDNTALVVATNAAEEARRTWSLMLAGTLTPVGGLGFNGSQPMLYLGDPTTTFGFRKSGNNIEVMIGSTVFVTIDNTAGFRSTFRLEENQGVVAASASTLTLGTGGNYFHVSGTTTISFLTTTNWQAGSRIDLYFDGALTVVHAATSPPANTFPFRLVGGVNLSAAAGSKLTLRLDSTLSQWVEISRSGA